MLKRNTGMEYKQLSLEEIQTLGKQCAEGDLAAREKLILSHLGLINLIMQEFIGKGTEIDDLYQEGCYGLIQAVDNYDYLRGTRLSTYASYWIRKRMKRAIARQNKYLLFNLDPELLHQVCHYRQCYYRLQDSLGRSPSIEELVYATGYSAHKVQDLQGLLFSFISLDAPLPGCPDISQHSDYSSILVPPEQSVPCAEDLAIHHLTNHNLNEVELCIQDIPLTKREREALKRRLGFTPSGKPESWTSISAATGLSRPTVKHDYLEAIRKLREGLDLEREEKIR